MARKRLTIVVDTSDGVHRWLLQSLVETVKKFARHSDMEVVRASVEIIGVTTPGVSINLLPSPQSEGRP